MYEVAGQKFEKRVGSRREVFDGIAYATSRNHSALIQEDLVEYKGEILTKTGKEVAIRKELEAEAKARRLEEKLKTIRRVGTRQQVFDGIAQRTCAGLTKDDLYEINGELYSKKEALGLQLMTEDEFDGSDDADTTETKAYDKNSPPWKTPRLLTDIIQPWKAYENMVDSITLEHGSTGIVISKNNSLYLVTAQKLEV